MVQFDSVAVPFCSLSGSAMGTHSFLHVFIDQDIRESYTAVAGIKSW